LHKHGSVALSADGRKRGMWQHPCADRKLQQHFRAPPQQRTPQHPRQQPRLIQGYYVPSNAPRQPRRSAREPDGARPSAYSRTSGCTIAPSVCGYRSRGAGHSRDARRAIVLLTVRAQSYGPSSGKHGLFEPRRNDNVVLLVLFRHCIKDVEHSDDKPSGQILGSVKSPKELLGESVGCCEGDGVCQRVLCPLEGIQPPSPHTGAAPSVSCRLLLGG
jgi:hypothetical protein